MRLACLFLLPALCWCQSDAQQAPKEKAAFDGVVLNAVTGEPLRKAKLTLRVNVAGNPSNPAAGARPTPAIRPAVTTSDLTGKFAFADIEPGDYQMSVSRDGFKTASFGLHTGGKKTEALVFSPGDHRTGFTVKLTPYGAIAGRVSDQDGDPVQGLQVAAMKYRYTTHGRELVEVISATSDDLGEYRIYNLESGRYFLRVSPPQLRMRRGGEPVDGYVPMYYPGVLEASAASPVDLLAGQQLRGLGFTVRQHRQASIRGHVSVPAGATAQVGLMTMTENGSSSTSGPINDKDGKFELTGIPPGGIWVTGAYSLPGQYAQTQVYLTVGTEDIEGVELRPLPPFEVTGTVRIDGTTTVTPSQLTIQLQGQSRSAAAKPKDDGGLLFESVSPFIYRIGSGGIGGLYLKSAQWGTSDVTDSDLDLTGGVPPNTSLTVVLGADGGQVEGHVTNDRSEPCDSAVVTLAPTGSHRSAPFHKRATTDEAGHFVIKGIAPGSYQIYAWDTVDTNAVVYDPDFLRPYAADGQPVEVAPNDKKDLNLKLILNKQAQ
ncbi:MAG TPA: carboxypeptidase regulatory-like domain-containing protein [Bryobacteraceae bacterium]|nr:carboxypeptidase regulatory-like domain-containing protein [Bryobacteraceae bacterium]